MRIGDHGDAVKRVQQALIAAGFRISDDGDFGERTEAAVKEFQRRKGLSDDGQVGPQTLAALGISTPADVTHITFTAAETTVPPIVKTRIGEYVALLERQHDRILEQAQDALARFSRTMTFASAREAAPDLVGTMGSKIVEWAVDRLFEATGAAKPFLELARSLFTAARDELARAGQARVSLEVGDWIRGQDDTIDALRRRGFEQEARGTLQQNMELAYLESDNRDAWFQALFNEIERSRNSTLPPAAEMEKQLYEQWINAHFRTISEDGPGCIEIRIRAMDGFELESCSVKAGNGDKVAHALNQLIGTLPGLHNVLDLKVRKRAMFYVRAIAGGTAWYPGWLDGDNNLVFNPISTDAAQAMRDPGWRNITRLSE